jgi:hypothetical protein
VQGNPPENISVASIMPFLQGMHLQHSSNAFYFSTFPWFNRTASRGHPLCIKIQRGHIVPPTFLLAFCNWSYSI